VAVHRALKSAGQGQGHRYSLGQWEKREGYIESGHLQVDNQRAERAIKPFVIGRKNRMFDNTADTANACAVLYNLVETAMANGLTPFDYLKLLIQGLP
jgi:transposase